MNIEAYRNICSRDVLVRLEFENVSKKSIEKAIKCDEENIEKVKVLLNNNGVNTLLDKYIKVKDKKEWDILLENHLYMVTSDEIRKVYDKNSWYLNEETSKYVADLYYDCEKNLRDIKSIEDLDKISTLRLKQIISVISRYNEEVSMQKIFFELMRSRNNALRLYDRMINIQSNKYYEFYKEYMDFKVNNVTLDKEMNWMLYASKKLEELKKYCLRHPEVLEEKSMFKRK